MCEKDHICLLFQESFQKWFDLIFDLAWTHYCPKEDLKHFNDYCAKWKLQSERQQFMIKSSVQIPDEFCMLPHPFELVEDMTILYTDKRHQLEFI